MLIFNQVTSKSNEPAPLFLISFFLFDCSETLVYPYECELKAVTSFQIRKCSGSAAALIGIAVQL